MFWLPRGFYGISLALTSLILTVLLLFWFWAVIAPAGIFAQLLVLVLLLMAGVMAYFILFFAFNMVTLFLYMFLLKRRMKKSFEKIMKRR